MMQLPIGYEDFSEVVNNKKLWFVDKSLLIKEIFDDESAKVLVITRPRRFGKTFNLSMLYAFLAEKVYGNATQGLFDHLKIAAAGKEYMQHQGKYPVIFVTFKDIDASNEAAAKLDLAELLSDLYISHEMVLLSSPKLSAHQKKNFEKILSKDINDAELKSAIKNLTHYLYLHYGTKPWLLIDEYDAPIQKAYVAGYYDGLVQLMRGILGTALKTNPYLHRAVITGILRVAKESLFSGLNNVEMYSLLRSEYGQYFGFTEDEVDDLLKQANLKAQADHIKAWYNGYLAGDTVVYNPWSVVNCIKRKGELVPYWVNTGDSTLIKELLIQSSQEFKTDFGYLLQDQPVKRIIDEGLVFGDLHKNPMAAWSLLFAAGYLKITAKEQTSDGLECVLVIPNEEVRNLYQQIIKRWLSDGFNPEWYSQFLDSLLTGDLKTFEDYLVQMMEQTISVHDAAQNKEDFYHGFMLGITASLARNKNYLLKSNRESGFGRYDHMILSHDKNKPTLILEFKRIFFEVEPPIDLLITKLAEAAQTALQQIDAKGYPTEARQQGCHYIIKIGLAFCGKRFKLCYNIAKVQE